MRNLTIDVAILQNLLDFILFFLWSMIYAHRKYIYGGLVVFSIMIIREYNMEPKIIWIYEDAPGYNVPLETLELDAHQIHELRRYEFPVDV